jgi:DNA topoisomerase-1
MVKLVKDKGYAKLEKKRLVPTESGLALCDFLVRHFPKVVDYAYTATLEKELDAIASGKATRLDVVMRFWGEFDPALKAVGTVVKDAVTQRSQPKPTGEKCPKCGGALVERRSKNGPFIGCSNYPTCKFSMAVGRVIGKQSAA